MASGFQNDLIYDVGMHKGEDAEFYLKKGFRVIGIEAVPALANEAAASLKEYVESGQLVILNVAIAEKEGALRFFESTACSAWGTLYPEWARRNQRLSGKPSTELMVEGATLTSILSEYGIPYYLKIDVEGADTLCLEALKGWKEKPKYVSIESTKTSWRDLEREFAVLTELGYTKFKVVAQHKAQQCPWPAREGRYVDRSFPPGSSGLFGEEAPGNWESQAEALKQYRRIFLRYKLIGDQGILTPPRLAQRLNAGWYDTHAALG